MLADFSRLFPSPTIMSSPFEQAAWLLEQYWDGRGLDRLLSHIDTTSDILNLRLASHVFNNRRQIQTKAFSTIYILTPPGGEQNFDGLSVLSLTCRNLIIKIAYPRQRASKPRDDMAEPHSVQHPIARSSPLPLPFRFLLQRRPTQMNQDILQQWHRILSLFTNITSLTISVNSDPPWPGCTDIEMLLIYLRIAIERVNFKHLRTVRFSPLHAAGLTYIRWAGFGAFGEALGRTWDEEGHMEVGRGMQERRCVWQRIQRLELCIQSPYLEGRTSDSQKSTFESVLADHLRSFRKSLRVLGFGWKDGVGPNPLLLGLQEERGYWDMLEEVWLRNVIVASGDVEAIKAKKLKRLMVKMSLPGNMTAWTNFLAT